MFLSPERDFARRIRELTGFVPARLSIFKLAFSHKSSQDSGVYAKTNNERLEYLGDAVLGTVVADYLFRKYPNANEGFLTKMRSKIVKRKSLNAIGKSMELDVLLAEYNSMRLSSSMLGNAVEALVGAVYLEKGYRPTERFIIERMLRRYLDVHELETLDDNYKSQLLEYCQKQGKEVGYQLLDKSKQDRRDRFRVAVLINNKRIATAEDFNKKSAEQLASQRALSKLGVLSNTNEKRGKTSRSQRRDSRGNKAQRSSSKPAATTSPPKTVRRAANKTHSRLQSRPPVPAKEQSSTVKKRVRRRKVQAADPQPAPISQTTATDVKKKAVTPIGSSEKPTKRKAARPRPKRRRNNTALGRATWNAVATFSVVAAITDDLLEEAPTPPPIRDNSTRSSAPTYPNVPEAPSPEIVRRDEADSGSLIPDRLVGDLSAVLNLCTPSGNTPSKTANGQQIRPLSLFTRHDSGRTKRKKKRRSQKRYSITALTPRKQGERKRGKDRATRSRGKSRHNTPARVRRTQNG